MMISGQSKISRQDSGNGYRRQKYQDARKVEYAVLCELAATAEGRGTGAPIEAYYRGAALDIVFQTT